MSIQENSTNELTILNSETLSKWMNERRKLGRDMVSIKGPCPKGATYEDGTLIIRPVNIAWRDTTTGEVFAIEYAQPESAEHL
jgi:hypothetical protein